MTRIIPITCADILADRDGDLLRQQWEWWIEAAERAVEERVAAAFGIPAELVGEPSARYDRPRHREG